MHGDHERGHGHPRSLRLAVNAAPDGGWSTALDVNRPRGGLDSQVDRLAIQREKGSSPTGARRDAPPSRGPGNDHADLHGSEFSVPPLISSTTDARGSHVAAEASARSARFWPPAAAAGRRSRVGAHISIPGRSSPVGLSAPVVADMHHRPAGADRGTDRAARPLIASGDRSSRGS